MKKVKLAAIALMALSVGVCSWAPEALSWQDGKIKQLEEQLAREPDNPKLLQQLGWAYFYQGRQGDIQAVDKAIAAFERCVALTPDDVSVARNLGLAYFLKVATLSRSRADVQEVTAAFERTLAAFDRALERTPTDTLLLSAHGSALTIFSGVKRDLNLLNKGIEEMNRAVSLNPKAIHARLFRGFTHLGMPAMFRDQKAAVEDLYAILGALPSGYNERAQGVMRVLLGDAHVEMKDLIEAKAEYEAAASLSSPAAAEARSRLAAMDQGQPDLQAIQRYRGNMTNCAICHTH